MGRSPPDRPLIALFKVGVDGTANAEVKVLSGWFVVRLVGDDEGLLAKVDWLLLWCWLMSSSAHSAELGAYESG